MTKLITLYNTTSKKITKSSLQAYMYNNYLNCGQKAALVDPFACLINLPFYSSLPT